MNVLQCEWPFGAGLAMAFVAWSSAGLIFGGILWFLAEMVYSVIENTRGRKR